MFCIPTQLPTTITIANYNCNYNLVDIDRLYIYRISAKKSLVLHHFTQQCREAILSAELVIIADLSFCAMLVTCSGFFFYYLFRIILITCNSLFIYWITLITWNRGVQIGTSERLLIVSFIENAIHAYTDNFTDLCFGVLTCRNIFADSSEFDRLVLGHLDFDRWVAVFTYPDSTVRALLNQFDHRLCHVFFSENR